MTIQIHGESKIKRKDNLPWKAFEKECMILKLDDGDYFALDEVGLFIWKLLDGEKTVDGIAKRVASKYEIASEPALTDLLEFLKRMHKLKFVDGLN